MLYSHFNTFILFADAPLHYQSGLQDPATGVAEAMIAFHDYLMFYLILIGVLVIWLLGWGINEYQQSRKNSVSLIFTHNNSLEITWTIIPALMLIAIAIPSFDVLYSTEEFVNPSSTLKAAGHQWYWSYEFNDAATEGFSKAYDSYLVPSSDLVEGSFRLLEVDHRVVLPIKTYTRVLITSADVIHSWAVPSLGIKVDATPGRLSQTFVDIKREGIYYGQCSEICGIHHAFMPIVVKALEVEEFINWILPSISHPEIQTIIELAATCVSLENCGVISTADCSAICTIIKDEYAQIIYMLSYSDPNIRDAILAGDSEKALEAFKLLYQVQEWSTWRTQRFEIYTKWLFSEIIVKKKWF